MILAVLTLSLIARGQVMGGGADLALHPGGSIGRIGQSTTREHEAKQPHPTQLFKICLQSLLCLCDIAKGLGPSTGLFAGTV